MPFSRATPIDDLYDAVADADLVIVPDAPLSSALNRRLDRPHLGTFAIPPRRLAAGRREAAEDRLAFLACLDETDVAWKRLAYAIGNILQCWEHQGRADAVLEYDRYADEVTEQAVRTMTGLDSTSKRLTEYRIDGDLDVAVVGESQLTTLELSTLPDEYDSVPLFTDEPFDLPAFHVFETATDIVETVVNAIDAERADDVGVVLGQASEYSSLIESALEAAEIPFYGGPGFSDDADHRAFLQLLRAGHTGSSTTIGELRPLLTRLGADVDVEHDEKRLSEFDHPDLAWLDEFCATSDDHTFAEALAAFEMQTDTDLQAFHDELAALGLADTNVTETAVDQLEFYLQSYEVPVDRENEGVLLADAKSAAYVDRPTVFFLGLDDDWRHGAPRRPWVDRDEQFARNIGQFQLLLQSGTEQHYLVKDTEGGSPVTPCLYFEELLDVEFERFSDLPSVRHSGPATDAGDGFSTEPLDASLDVDDSDVATVSQSSLNSYVNSPRDYFFGRIVDGPDKEHFAQGNLFHDFAEFYATHPDVVDDDAIDEVLDVFCEETRPFMRRVDEVTRRSRYRIGLETIMAYLDEHPPEDVPFLSPGKPSKNRFAELFGKPVDSPATERWFRDTDLGLKGKIDLVHSPSELLDYKSGSKKSASQVVSGAAIDPPTSPPNYQALLYLAYWRTQRSDERLEFTFFHFLETLGDVVTGDADLDDCLTTVTYHPKSFKAYARSEEMFERLRDEGSGKCRKTLKQVDYTLWAGVFDDEPLPQTTDSDELIDSPFGQTLYDRLVAAVGDYAYVETGTKQALRDLARERRQAFFKGDVDAFEEFVDERLEELNRRRRGEERFPIEGPGGEPYYRYVDHRDLLLEGER